MARSQRLTISEVRAVTRLAWEATELRHDLVRQQTHLIDGLTQLVGAQQGFALGFDNFLPDAELTMRYALPSTQIHPSAVRYLTAWGRVFSLKDEPTTAAAIGIPGQVVATATRWHYEDRIWQAFEFTEMVARQVEAVDIMPAWFRRKNGQDITCLSPHRLGKNEKPFTPREVKIARLLMAELHHLYATGRLEPPASPLDLLPPRQCDIARRLLAGESPKRIAFELQLSIHTVRDHIRAIYDHLGVADRTELMARYMNVPS